MLGHFSTLVVILATGVTFLKIPSCGRSAYSIVQKYYKADLLFKFPRYFDWLKEQVLLRIVKFCLSTHEL